MIAFRIATPPRRLAVLALLALSCRAAPPAERTLLELVPALPLLERHAATGCIEPGSPAGASHLLGGWWMTPETETATGRRFLWAIGEASVLEITQLSRDDTSLHLIGRPYLYPGAPPQRVTPFLNGYELAAVELPAEGTEAEVPVPAAALRMGRNRLELRYAHHASPAETVGGRDPRQLAVAWDRICLGERSDPAEPPRPDRAGSGLVLPTDSQLDLFLELPAGARLRADGLTLRGGARLEIERQARGGSPELVATESHRRRPFEVELSDGAPGELVRLSLRSRGGEETGAGVLLERPRLLAPPEIAPPATAGDTKVGRPEPGTASERPPDILIYLVDTLRADRLGPYGQRRDLSPRLDAFARDAVTYSRVLAQSSWTRATVASIFTGVWPLSHGTNGRSDALPAAALTLAEILRERGYATAAFFTNPNLDRTFGLDQGFESYEREEDDVSSERITERAVAWLEARDRDRPFFLYLHSQDPHDPYQPPPDLRARFAAEVPAGFPSVPGRKLEVDTELVERFRSLYDAEVAANDRSFGELVENLRRLGLYRDTLVVFLSDHGEEFQEHGGWKHGRTLHAESVDVPLIVKLPGLRGAGTRIEIPTEQIDLLPTLLGEAAIPLPPGLEGRPLPATAGSIPPRPLFSYLHLDGEPQLAVLDGEWKLIEIRETGRPTRSRLYRWREDPGEIRDLAQEEPIVVGRLRFLLAERRAATHPLRAAAAEIDPELEESLRALGYL